MKTIFSIYSIILISSLANSQSFNPHDVKYLWKEQYLDGIVVRHDGNGASDFIINPENGFAPTTWTTYLQTCANGDDCCVSRLQNTDKNWGMIYKDERVSIDGDEVKITATYPESNPPCWKNIERSFESGVIHTDGYYNFGKYEIVAKFPPTTFLWPTFWMNHGDEIDIFDGAAFTPDNFAWALSRYYGCPSPSVLIEELGRFTGPDLSAGFHTFTFEWTPFKMTLAFDGVIFKTSYKYYNQDWVPLDIEYGKSISPGYYKVNPGFIRNDRCFKPIAGLQLYSIYEHKLCDPNGASECLQLVPPGFPADQVDNSNFVAPNNLYAIKEIRIEQKKYEWIRIATTDNSGNTKTFCVNQPICLSLETKLLNSWCSGFTKDNYQVEDWVINNFTQGPSPIDRRCGNIINENQPIECDLQIRNTTSGELYNLHTEINKPIPPQLIYYPNYALDCSSLVVCLKLNGYWWTSIGFGNLHNPVSCDPSNVLFNETSEGGMICYQMDVEHFTASNVYYKDACTGQQIPIPFDKGIEVLPTFTGTIKSLDGTQQKPLLTVNMIEFNEFKFDFIPIQSGAFATIASVNNGTLSSIGVNAFQGSINAGQSYMTFSLNINCGGGTRQLNFLVMNFKRNFKVYPNPTSNIVTVLAEQDIYNDSNGELVASPSIDKIWVYNQALQPIYYSENPSQDVKQMNISLAQEANGLYYVEIVDEEFDLPVTFQVYKL